MARGIVISNTTPIINFAEIGRLDILEALFGRIAIPPAVAKELSSKSELFQAAALVPSLQFVSEVTPGDLLLVKSFAISVHPGEAECLALGMKRPGSLLLLDDLAARELAKAGGLLFTGTLGCLAQAKRKGVLKAIEPVIQDLREKARFWISDPLVARVLKEAGER